MRRLAFALAGLAPLLAPAPALAQDAADLVVRLNRVEGQMRQLSGQVEQLQHENGRLRDQLRKFQEDVEFRFTERGGPAERGGAPRPAASAAPPAPTAAAPRPTRRGDAFDPAESPSAPGAPRPLGGGPPGASASPGGIAAIIEEDGRPDGPADRGGPAPRPIAPTQAAPPSVAATGTGDARADYDVAYAYLIQKQHGEAEMAFRRFLQSHPRDRLAADATYWLGETHLQRGRHREAAEQFLKVSTEYARSAKAPEAMLKLGTSLNALGAKDQACATLAEVERKYPTASAAVRQGVERERSRARCPA